MEQAVTVQSLDAALFNLHGRWHKAVRADNLEVIIIPQNKVQIVIIVAVGIPALSAAFLHGAKGNLAQSPQLAQQRRLFLPVALPQIDGFTIAGFAQTFGLRQLRFSVALSSGRAMAHWVLKTPGNPLPSRITC